MCSFTVGQARPCTAGSGNCVRPDIILTTSECFILLISISHSTITKSRMIRS